MKLSELFQRRLEAFKPTVTKASIERDLHVTWSAVHQWFTGATTPDAQHLPELCDILGLRNVRYAANKDVIQFEEVMPRHLLTDKEGKNSPPALRLVSPVYPDVTKVDLPLLDATRQTMNIEVRGVVIGGGDGDFSFNDTVTDYVSRPPGLMAAQNVIALRVVSDSMEPRYFANDLIYVSQMRAAVSGDFVVVELHPEEEDDEAPAFLKRLKARTSTFIVCEQFNPAGDVRFAKERVRQVLRVFTPNEVLGV